MSTLAAPLPSGGAARRALVAWCPDWPIRAAVEAYGLAEDAPVALVRGGEVYACSASARADGVRAGLRQREAQSRCTDLVVHPYDAELDARGFEPVALTVEETIPGIAVLRPGLLALRARGPARYYRGEAEAALVLLGAFAAAGVPDARIGIADDLVAGMHAARATRAAPPGGHAGAAEAHPSIRLVEPGGSPAFLAPLPIAALGAPELVLLLQRLGVHTFGDLAGLDPVSVRDRFGAEGAVAQAAAAGCDPSPVVPRTPPLGLDQHIEFEPALENVDQLAFGFRQAAERFANGVTDAGLVCTALRVRLWTEEGRVAERVWQHPRWFTAADVLDRVRWQVQGERPGSGIDAPVAAVEVIPESLDAAVRHEPGLWGGGGAGGGDERVANALARVQSMLGHAAVVTPVLTGGRGPGERTVLVPWGDAPPGGLPALAASRERPWPGSVPGPAPALVYPAPLAVHVADAEGRPVDVDDRGRVTARPAGFVPPGGGPPREVRSWAGPWTVSARWWSGESAGGSRHRFQLIDGAGSAWLLMLSAEGWTAEGCYD